MIFSKEKWNNGDEIRAFVKLNTAISFSTFETPLRNAFNLFITPLIGRAMAVEVIEIYQYGPDPNRIEKNVPEATDQERLDKVLLQICQRANANLALWYEFDAISVRITDAGFQRQESENGTLKPAYKYQEDNLRRNYKNRGFDALDELLDFLFEHVSVYTAFASSPVYKTQRSAIVRGTRDVDAVYGINLSRIVFLRLQPHLRFVEEMMLVPAIGEKLYERLLDGLVNQPDDPAERERIEQLRRACSNYIVTMAVRRLVMETGSLTDRGLYFTTIETGEKGNERHQLVETERISVQIQNLQADAEMYMAALQRVIKTHYANLAVGDPQRVFDRENNHKRTFWT